MSRFFYIVLFCALCVLNWRFITAKAWTGDFWHHTALVNFLRHAYWPQEDPFIANYPPLIPYYPYELLAAVMANMFGLNGYIVLAIFSYFNLALLFVGISFFSAAFCKSKQVAPFLAILLLGCWGSIPPFFSSFFHARVFLYVLSYPSTFAFALALVVASSVQRKVKQEKPIKTLLPEITGSVAIVLIHPITFLFLGVLIASAVVFSSRASIHAKVIYCGALLGIPLFAWTIWPFFPLLTVLGKSSYSADPMGYVVYQNVLGTIGMGGCGALFLLSPKKDERRNTLRFMAVSFLVIYLFGWMSGNWNYGRVLSFLCFALQAAIAGELTVSENGPMNTLRRALAVAILVISAGWASNEFQQGMRFVSVQERKMKLVDRSSAYLDEFEKRPLVVADESASFVVAALGGRVVAFDVPPFFREEFKMRTADRKAFFKRSSTLHTRCTILEKYKPDFVLLDLLKRDEDRLARELLSKEMAAQKRNPSGLNADYS